MAPLLKHTARTASTHFGVVTIINKKKYIIQQSTVQALEYTKHSHYHAFYVNLLLSRGHNNNMTLCSGIKFLHKLLPVFIVHTMRVFSPEYALKQGTIGCFPSA